MPKANVMRRWLARVMAGLVLATPAVAAESTNEVVDRVQARYDDTRDFTAKVHQELRIASAGKTLAASGTVTFEKPGKMRWTLTDGVEQVIVADGTTLWFYEPEEQQVLRAPFQAAFRSTTPISFLTGVGRLRDDFDVTVEAGTGDDAATGELRLLLRPRRSEGDLGSLRVTVDPATYDIVGAEVTDPIGNVTRLRFSELRRNVGPAADTFRFDVPPGIDVVDAPLGN